MRKPLLQDSEPDPGKLRAYNQNLPFNCIQNFESSRCLRLPTFLRDGSAAIHSLVSFLITAIPRFLTTTFCVFPEFMPARSQSLSLSGSNPFTATFPRTTRSQGGSVVRAEACKRGSRGSARNFRDELRKRKYPLYFMDFVETVSPALPRFPGMRPYDQIPFQWSVHVQRQPGAAPEHFEFLATDKSDPRRAFISALCNALGDRGSIVVYHQQFESQRLSDLASWLPEFSSRITKIQRRLWDLLPIIRNHVYHPAFGGSYSLKSVLPALVPEMSYAGLEVADGQAAGLAWQSLY